MREIVFLVYTNLSVHTYNMTYLLRIVLYVKIIKKILKCNN